MKKCTKIYNARVQLLFYFILSLLFGSVAVVVCLSSNRNIKAPILCFAVFSRLTKKKLNLFFDLCSRFDIEICKTCECDYIQSSTSYGSLQNGKKDCGHWSANFLDYLIQVGSSKSAGESSTSMYARFVSDDTVHRKGFNLSYVAGSSAGKSAYELINSPK